MKAYVLITIRTGEIRDVLKQLRMVEQIHVAEMTFGEYDAIAILEAKNLSEVGRVLASDIQPIPGIENTMTCLAVDI